MTKTYGLLMDRAAVEQRVRQLHAAGYKIRDLSALFSLHPLQVQHIVGSQTGLRTTEAKKRQESGRNQYSESLPPEQAEASGEAVKQAAATIGVEMLPLLEEEGRKRSAANLKHGDERPDVPISAHRESERSVELAGNQVGVGRTMIQKAKQVKNNDAALFEQVKRGEVQLEDAHRKVKEGTPIPPTLRSPTKRAKDQLGTMLLPSFAHVFDCSTNQPHSSREDF